MIPVQVAVVVVFGNVGVLAVIAAADGAHGHVVIVVVGVRFSQGGYEHHLFPALIVAVEHARNHIRNPCGAHNSISDALIFLRKIFRCVNGIEQCTGIFVQGSVDEYVLGGSLSVNGHAFGGQLYFDIEVILSGRGGLGPLVRIDLMTADIDGLSGSGNRGGRDFTVVDALVVAGGIAVVLNLAPETRANQFVCAVAVDISGTDGWGSHGFIDIRVLLVDFFLGLVQAGIHGLQFSGGNHGPLVAVVALVSVLSEYRRHHRGVQPVIGILRRGRIFLTIGNHSQVIDSVAVKISGGQIASQLVPKIFAVFQIGVFPIHAVKHALGIPLKLQLAIRSRFRVFVFRHAVFPVDSRIVDHDGVLSVSVVVSGSDGIEVPGDEIIEAGCITGPRQILGGRPLFFYRIVHQKVVALAAAFLIIAYIGNVVLSARSVRVKSDSIQIVELGCVCTCVRCDALPSAFILGIRIVVTGHQLHASSRSVVVEGGYPHVLPSGLVAAHIPGFVYGELVVLRQQKLLLSIVIWIRGIIGIKTRWQFRIHDIVEFGSGARFLHVPCHAAP